MPASVHGWEAYTFYFFFYSFCGWLLETVQNTVRQKRFINRGFLNGPLCPIYGCGVVLMLVLLLPVRDRISSLAVALPVIFLCGAALCSMVEYVTSWLMETLFHARWWDYSTQPFNLNGRICLWISAAWGVLASGVLYLVQPLLEQTVALLYRWHPALPLWMAVVLLVLLTADCAVSFKVARTIGNKLEQMDSFNELIKSYLEGLDLPSAEELSLKLEAAHERASRRLKEVAEALPRVGWWPTLPPEERRRGLNEAIENLRRKRGQLMTTRILQRRVLHAFPTMRRKGDSSALREWRERLSSRKTSPPDEHR